MTDTQSKLDETVDPRCPDAERMGKHECQNRFQCWEPCGELGKSLDHARIAPAQPIFAETPSDGEIYAAHSRAQDPEGHAEIERKLEAVAPAAVEDEPVAYWLAVRDGDTEEIFAIRADDGNGGRVARAFVNGYINDQPHPGQWHLVPAYTRPQPAQPEQQVPEGWQLVARGTEVQWTDPQGRTGHVWDQDGELKNERAFARLARALLSAAPSPEKQG